MITGLVAQMLLFLLAAALVGFLSGWFLARQRDAEPASQETLEARDDTTKLTADLAAVREELAAVRALLEGQARGTTAKKARPRR